MPEFWTCRIVNGPTTWTPSPSTRLRGDDVLRHLVGDDRRERDRARARATAHAWPRRSVWRARPVSTRPSTSRRGPRAAGAGSLTLPRLCACSRCRERPRDSPPAARAGSRLPQFVQMPYVPSSMRCSARVDLGDDLLGVVAERVVDLAAERRRWRSRRGGCRPSRGPPRPRRRASRDARRGASRARARPAARSSRSASRKCSVSMLVTASPFCLGRPPERRGEAPLDERRPDPRQLHDLLPAAVTRNELQGGAGQRERLGEEAEDGLVRAPALRRLGDAHLPGVAVSPDERRRGPLRG